MERVPKLKLGAADPLRRPLADTFLHVAIVGLYLQMPTSVPNFQLSSSIGFGDMRGSQNKKWELLISPDAPADKFLYRALVRVNEYKCAKFQLPSFISY